MNQELKLEEYKIMSWSPFLSKEGMTCLGLEYFVNENDSMWNSNDDDLIELAKNELEYLKIIDTGKLKMGIW